tara:strand:- start:3040 stop:3369 length:330 start_codon:yes stop_codon:yes gene_type:complete
MESLKRKEYNKIYREKNKEKLLEYNKTPECLKSKKISEWKTKMKIILRENEDWDSVYEYYLICERCDNCDVTLTKEKYSSSTSKCLDHDHNTGFIRNILCNSCNIKRGA